jgi:thioredoxin 1
MIKKAARRSSTTCKQRLSLLICAATLGLALDGLAGANESERISAAVGQNPADGSAPPSVTASKTSTADSKSSTADARRLAGHGADDVEAALGKPSGKMQTAQGPLWLYAEWRVQFDQQGRVLQVEPDRPVRLAKVDPSVLAASAALDKAAAERAAADDAARAKAAAAQAEKVRVISNKGQEVDLPTLLPEGKITIVDFYAEWCGPCRELSPHLEQLAKDDPDVVLLKIDIVNWKTPVTQQFGINSVPNVRVFNRAKTQVGDETNELREVARRVEQAKKS